MLSKIKKFFFLKTKGVLVFFLLAGVLLGFFWPNLTYAIWWNPTTWSWTNNLGDKIVFGGIGVIFHITGVITVGLANLSIRLLLWITSPDFTDLPYTRPGPMAQGGNPIIEYGLDVTQSFANIILVLVLIYIGLATILRLAGYETKKLLVTFIIVALLVNFAPLICGLIVDAANIAMNYFLGNAAQFLNFSDRIGQAWEDLRASFQGGTVEELHQAAWNSFVLGFVAFLAFLIFLLFAILFLVRYIAIWILVILSPIAFVCMILPATKRIWTMWWNQLLQWSFIGVTAGFFLYLGSHVAATGFIRNPTDLNVDNAVLGLLPALVPIVFLYIGLITALQTSAMGASTVIAASRRYGGGAARWAGTTTGRAIGETATYQNIKEGLIRQGENLRLFAPGSADKARGERIKKAEKYVESIPLDDKGKETIKKTISKKPRNQKEIDIRNAMIKRAAEKRFLDFSSPEEAGRILSQAQRQGLDTDTVLKARPDLANNFTIIDPVTNRPRQMTVQEVVEETSAKDFWKNIQDEGLTEEVVFWATTHSTKVKSGRNAKRKQKQRFIEKLADERIDPIYNAASPTDQENFAAGIDDINRQPQWHR